MPFVLFPSQRNGTLPSCTPVLVAAKFLTLHSAESSLYRESLQAIMKGPTYITLRHRLHCQIIRNSSAADASMSSDSSEYLVLNEVSIDRGMSSALSNLECFCDGHFVTIVQGDGLVISSPSGSTAYSLAAGGSVVHPQVF